MSFNPPADGAAWAMDKLGEWVAPDEVVDGAQRGLHAVTSGVRCTRTSQDGRHHAFFGSPDVPLVAWGAPTPFPTPIHGATDVSQGASFLLWDNIWNTNYVFWWPYDTASPEVVTDNVAFRFTIDFVDSA